MFDQYLQTNPQLYYPLSEERIFQKENRDFFHTEWQKIPKSELLENAQYEAEAGEVLLRKCVEMVEHHGFTYEKGECKLWRREPSFNEVNNPKWYFAPDPRLIQLLSHNQATLLNDDVYLEYLSYKHAPILHKYIDMAEAYGLPALKEKAGKEGLTLWGAFDSVFYHKLYDNHGRSTARTKLFEGRGVADLLHQKGFFELKNTHKRKTHLRCADDVIALMGEVSAICNSLNAQYRKLLLRSDDAEERWFPTETVSGISDNILKTLAEYLNDYEQEKAWDCAVTEFISDYVQSIDNKRLQRSKKGSQAEFVGNAVKKIAVVYGILTVVLCQLLFCCTQGEPILK